MNSCYLTSKSWAVITSLKEVLTNPGNQEKDIFGYLLIRTDQTLTICKQDAVGAYIWAPFYWAYVKFFKYIRDV